MKLPRAEDLVPITVLTVTGTIALLLTFWGISVADNVFNDYKDSRDVVYLGLGGLLLLVALVPGAIAFIVARETGPRVAVPGVVLAMLLAVLALTWVEAESGRAGPTTSPPNVTPAPGTPASSPVATPSIGAR